MGPECIWTEESNGHSDHEDPSWVPTLFAAAYVAAGAALAWGHRLEAGAAVAPPPSRREYAQQPVHAGAASSQLISVSSSSGSSRQSP